MPKCCVVLECRRTEGGRESYYKFPLHDKVRLKQWLANINMENFFPTKNQYLCSKHFKPSCFQVRWGVRYLRHDAVPTIFSSGAVNRTHAAKSKSLTSAQNVNGEVCIPTVSRLAIGETLPLSNTLAITLDPNSSASQMSIHGAEMLVKNTDTLAVHNTVMGAVNLIPLVHIVESFDGLSLALAPSQGFSSVALPIEVTGVQQIHEMPLVEPVVILSEEQLAATSLQCGFYNGQVLQCAGEEVPTFIAMSGDSGSALVIENISIEPYFETGVSTATPATMSTEDLMAYLETMQTATVVPAISTGPLPPLKPSSETMLSTSITRPIASTVPIVSKHGKEMSVSLSEELSTDPPEEPDGLSESLATCELVSVVVNLQNKVKALQQRHQKHCSKLEVMEGVVEQLKTENLVSEEKMNLLELACLNSTPASEDNTMAIVCEDDDQTLMYSLPVQGENPTVYHITEQ